MIGNQLQCSGHLILFAGQALELGEVGRRDRGNVHQLAERRDRGIVRQRCSTGRDHDRVENDGNSFESLKALGDMHRGEG
ncbi:hypothetical protein D3C83_59750 [compost metagenome]